MEKPEKYEVPQLIIFRKYVDEEFVHGDGPPPGSGESESSCGGFVGADQ